jgi:YD repeat-containing protein
VSFVPVGPTLGGSSSWARTWWGDRELAGKHAALQLRLQPVRPDLYKYTGPDGQVFVVDKTAGLKSLTDRAGNVLTMTPAGIKSSHPQVAGSTLGIVFERDGEGRITQVTDPLGKSVVYTYDTNGDLQSVTDRETNTTRFSYLEEPAHHLETIDDPLGRTPIRNEYDPSGRLIAHVDAFNNRIEYQHDLLGRQEIVRDRTGAQRVLEYDERGNVLRETDPLGKVTVRTFDARNNRLTETEPYDPANPPDPIPTTSYSHDTSDNLLSTTDPLGHTTGYTYNSTRQVLTTTDARNHTTTNVYDPKGNLLTTTDALDNVTSYTYDDRGNVRTQTVTVNGTPQVTGYAHDSYGRLQTETDPTGHVTSYTYDPSGNRLTQTTSRTVYGCSAVSPPVCSPSGPETLTTTYTYDDNGRLETTTDPDGSLTRTVCDVLSARSSYDKRNRKTAYEYDEIGRLEKTTYVDNTTEEHGYDAEGRRTSSKDRGGRTTGYEYDSLGRLKKTTYADTTFTENTYDDAGRLVATKDARGKTTSYEYDEAGRRTAVVDPLNNRTGFTYDANGNQETVTDAKGNVTTYQYDALNRRTKTIFPSSDGIAPPTETTTGYDELGRRTSETDQANKTTSLEYDSLGRLTAVVDAANQRTSYGYDELGNRLSQTDANGHTTWFLYDKLGRQVARILPDGKREAMTYDPAGNLESRTDFMGRVTNHTYDDNTASRTYPTPQRERQLHVHPDGAARNGHRRPRHHDLQLRPTRPPPHPDPAQLRLRHRHSRLYLRRQRQPPHPDRRDWRPRPHHELHLRRCGTPRRGDGPGRPPLRPRLRPQRQPPVPRPPQRRRDNLRLRHPEPPHEPGTNPASEPPHPELRLHPRPGWQSHKDRRVAGSPPAAHPRLQLRRPLPPDRRVGHGVPRPRLQQDLRLRPRRQPAVTDDGPWPRRLPWPTPPARHDQLRLRRPRPPAQERLGATRSRVAGTERPHDEGRRSHVHLNHESRLIRVQKTGTVVSMRTMPMATGSAPQRRSRAPPPRTTSRHLRQPQPCRRRSRFVGCDSNAPGPVRPRRRPAVAHAAARRGSPDSDRLADPLLPRRRNRLHPKAHRRDRQHHRRLHLLRLRRTPRAHRLRSTALRLHRRTA